MIQIDYLAVLQASMASINGSQSGCLFLSLRSPGGRISSASSFAESSGRDLPAALQKLPVALTGTARHADIANLAEKDV